MSNNFFGTNFHQEGHLDTMISTLGQLVVDLLTFVLKGDICTDRWTNGHMPNLI